VNPFVTDTKEISWNTGGLLSVAAPRFAGATGFLNAFAGQQIGPLTLTASTGFGSLTWISLTADSLGQARRSLLTISSMSQNSGMVWDGTTSIHNNWGGSPTQVAPLLVTLQLRVNADSIRVYPLDPSGGETRGFSTYFPLAPNTFSPTIDQSRSLSMWFGIEAFGIGAATAAPGEAAGIPFENRLEQNFPNPFNPTTVIRYQLSAVKTVKLCVYDLLGREVAVLVNERKPAGRYEARVDGAGLSSGVYIYRLIAGNYVETRRMVLLK
jgi:hypothetical protein